MERYDFENIRKNANCIEIAEQAGLQPDPHGRCAATWRGGTNKSSVHLEPDKWYDHGAGVGGSALDLYALIHCGGTGIDAIQRAQDALGRSLGLKPSAMRPCPNEYRSRYDELIIDGFVEKCRYTYTNAGGLALYQVVRMEHPTQPKEFLQCRADGQWGLKEAERVLYRLPHVIKSPWVCIVEGEKDADTLTGVSIPVTTNSGGAKAWQKTFNEVLAGKKIVLLPDNDEVGRAHMLQIARALSPLVPEIRIIQLSQKPKGDVTDWFMNEGGGRGKLMEIIKAAPKWEDSEDGSVEMTLAIEANKTPFRNYTQVKVKTDRGARIDKVVRPMQELLHDMRVRFLGFPRILGNDTLFDLDHGTDEIHPMHTTSELFAWIYLKSGTNIEWNSAPGFVSREDFFKGLSCPHEGQRRYRAISCVPDWPIRDDVFYHHPPLPRPTKDFTSFWEFIDRFSYTTAEDRRMFASCCLETLRYEPGSSPLFVIGSPDGQGSGKTAAVEMLAELLGQEAVQTTARQIKEHFDQLLKRLLSVKGRERRILLLDNLTGRFQSEELAGLITTKSLSERPAFGRGEETRSNDLTYIATSNGATLDTDLVVRSIFIDFDKPKRTGQWKAETQAFIKANRLQILSDMIGLLDTYAGATFDPRTRFPGWELCSLWAACQGDSDFHDSCLALTEDRGTGSNGDEDLAEKIMAVIMGSLQESLPEVYAYAAGGQRVFLHSPVVEKWMAEKLPRDVSTGGGRIMTTIRGLVKSGSLPDIENQDRRSWYLGWGKAKKKGLVLNLREEKGPLDDKPDWLVMDNGGEIQVSLSQ